MIERAETRHGLRRHSYMKERGRKPDKYNVFRGRNKRI